MNSWIIPEHTVGPDIRVVLDCRLKDGENLCFSGFFRSGKTVSLLLFARRIKRENPAARILLLGYSNLWVEIIKAEFHKFGFNAQVETYWSFKNSSSISHHYDYILCDDVQVIGRSMLCEIKNRSDQVIVAINPDLTIFEKDSYFNESTLTINDLKEILQSEVFVLSNFSGVQSDTIIRLAKSFRDKGNKQQYLCFESSISNQLHLCEATTRNEELKYLINKATISQDGCSSAVIMIPTKKGIKSFVQALIQIEGKEPWPENNNRWGGVDFSNLNKYMSSIGLNFQCLGGNFNKSNDLDNKINIMTFHASMGFTFDNVFLPDMSSDLFISQNETISRNLFVMALTRARKNVYFLHSGTRHPFIEELSDICDMNVMNMHDDNHSVPPL